MVLLRQKRGFCSVFVCNIKVNANLMLLYKVSVAGLYMQKLPVKPRHNYNYRESERKIEGNEGREGKFRMELIGNASR